MKVIEATTNSFEEEILKKEGKVLVDFNATWCGPCRMLAPILEEVAEELKETKIFSIDVDKEPNLAQKYNIFSIPCLIVFEKGEEIKRSVGLKSKDEIKEMIGE